MEFMKWFHRWWYEYLFEKPWTLRKVICRARAHPCGVVWYRGPDASGFAVEPDMTCKNCGDDLG